MIKTPLSTVIGGAFWTPEATVINGAKLSFEIVMKKLFANGEQGFWYDPNDLSTMYQDAAGTIPITAAGQPVGLMLDKSGRNNHAFQTSSASRPILQRNATTGAYYLAFDGADDFLQTNSIDFTATDKVSLFAGVRKLVDGSYGAIAELSSSSDTNPNGLSFVSSSFQGCSFQTGSPPDRTFGTVPMLASAPISICVAAQYDRAKSDVSEIKVRYNSGAYSSNGLSLEGASATGNFGNHPLYIGRRAGTSLPFNGHIYSLIGIGRLTTDSETIALEKSIAKNVGVTL